MHVHVLVLVLVLVLETLSVFGTIVVASPGLASSWQADAKHHGHRNVRVQHELRGSRSLGINPRDLFTGRGVN